tara:strand:- start:14 stop:370 length:357 start_codon:yes stop_codon:yes gene_type:complete
VHLPRLQKPVRADQQILAVKRIRPSAFEMFPVFISQRYGAPLLPRGAHNSDFARGDSPLPYSVSHKATEGAPSMRIRPAYVSHSLFLIEACHLGISPRGCDLQLPGGFPSGRRAYFLA